MNTTQLPMFARNFLGATCVLLAMLLAAPAMAAPPEAQGDPATQLSRTKKAKSANVKKSSRARKRKRIKIRKKKKVRTRSGAYFNAGLGLTSVSDSPGDTTFDEGILLHVGLGYRFNKTMAFEGNVLAQFEEIQTRNDSAESNTLTGGNLSLKYFFPIMPPRVEAYVQGGLGYISIEDIPGRDEDISGATLDFGGGLDYRTSKTFAIGGRLGYSTLLSGFTQATNNNNGTIGGDDAFSSLSAMLTINLQL